MKNLFISLSTLLLSALSYSQEILLLKQNGKVVIGDTAQITTPGNYKLYVQNGIMTEKVKVSLRNQAEWSDDSWNAVPTLAEVKKSIARRKHLVNMPSAETLVKNGYELKEMDAKLLEQIEWIWLHLLELKKENAELKKEIAGLKDSAKKE
jgi:hypothetical protein